MAIKRRAERGGHHDHNHKGSMAGVKGVVGRDGGRGGGLQTYFKEEGGRKNNWGTLIIILILRSYYECLHVSSFLKVKVSCPQTTYGVRRSSSITEPMMK